MIKIGIITDIHSNVIALESMLDFFNQNDCHEIICAGDIIGIGPFPEETVTKVRSLSNLFCVYGNHDHYLVKGVNKPSLNRMSESQRHHHQWQHNSLSHESYNFIKTLPRQLELERDGLSIYVEHYPLPYTEIIQEPSLEDCEKMFRGINKDIYIYGHDHRTSTVCVDHKMYINTGSLGCPHTNQGIARGGVLCLENGNSSFEPVNVMYDLTSIISEIDRIQYSDFESIKKFFFGIS